MGMQHEIHPAWTLILGMGPSTAPLEPLLLGLAPGYGSVRIEILEGPAPALPAPSLRGRLVLDASSLDANNLADVRQYLSAASGWELILLDHDGTPCLARELVGPPHVYWWPGPVTVEQVTQLLHPPRPRDSAKLPEQATEQAPKPTAPVAPALQRQSPLQFTDPDEELGAIQAILSAPLDEPEDHQLTLRPLRDDGEDPLGQEIFEDLGELEYDPEREDANMHFPVSDPFTTEQTTTWGEHAKPLAQTGSDHPVDLLLRDLTTNPSVSLEEALADELPTPILPKERLNTDSNWQSMDWYKGQVADLNDLAQRLHLDLFALEEDASLQGHSIAIALREDVARLSQFARTLGFLAAPPGQGHQTFSLATLVQEQLGTLTGLGPEAPRFLFRAGEDALVRSDKMLLVSALDAVLQVAGQCAGAHPETVRVECQVQEAFASVSISFEPGPIVEFTAEQVFEPYALRTCLENIGPNALSAARSILRSQGGDLSLDNPASGPFRFSLSLPQAT